MKSEDAWFDLDLETESRVVLRRGIYERRGAVGHWLTSDAFDLATDRGSIEAEQVVLRARELLSGDETIARGGGRYGPRTDQGSFRL